MQSESKESFMKAYMKKKITPKEFKNRQEKMIRDLEQFFSRKEKKEMKKDMIKFVQYRNIVTLYKKRRYLLFAFYYLQKQQKDAII